MNMTLLIGICGAVLFYRVAYVEHLSPWMWSVASLGLTLGLGLLGSGATGLIVGQVVLFLVLWGYNARRKFPAD